MVAAQNLPGTIASLMDVLSDPIALIDDAKRVRAVNPTWTTLFGDVSSLQEILHADDRTRFDARWDHLLKTNEMQQLTSQLVDQNGQSQLMDATLIPYVQTDDPAYLMVLRQQRLAMQHDKTLRRTEELQQINTLLEQEITERKLLDTQFRLLNKAVEASNSAITIADVRLPDAPLVYVNPAFEHITGYISEDIIGKNCRFLQNDDRDQPGIEIIRGALRQGKPCTVTLRNYRKDGTLFWNELRLTPMQATDGDISHYVGVATDITERIEAEQRIKSQNEALLRTNRALAEARKQAEAATRLKSEFLATMSHELRTPMNAVIGYTEIMLAGMTGEMNAEQNDYLNRVLTNAEHLLSLINDVLDLSKIEAGRVDLVRKPFHLGELLDEITAQTRGLAEEKGLGFESTLDERLPEVLIGDPDRLKQIAINLLSNAIKFTNDGHIRIVMHQHGSSTWTLTVRDTGIGIPKANQQAIFEEFRQLDATWQRQHGGTGLGLAIVRKLALLMGGSIRVQSSVDEGSTFIVFLPIEIPK